MMRFFLLLLLLISMMLFSLMIGHVPMTFEQVLSSLQDESGSLESVIIQEIRLPRMLLAVLAGGTLGMAGAAMQGFLRNPLAEPGLLGISNGAALGAVIAIYGGFAAASPLALPLAAMAGALLAVWLVYVLAGSNASAQTLILSGIAVSSVLGAGVAIALNLAPNPFAAMEVVFWLMGSLADRTMGHVWLVLPFIGIGAIFLLSCARGLDALSLGETTASSMGVSIASVQWRLAIGIACAVGASVAVSGSIGFIGLVVPHLLRPMVGHMPGKLLPASAFGGAILLLAADILVRVIPTSGMELRLGVITALLGAPFFLLLLIKTRRRLV